MGLGTDMHKNKWVPEIDLIDLIFSISPTDDVRDDLSMPMGHTRKHSRSKHAKKNLSEKRHTYTEWTGRIRGVATTHQN